MEMLSSNLDAFVRDAGAIRLGIFAGLLALLLVLERHWPRRAGPRHRRLRWPPNLGLVFLDAVLLRLLLPAGAIGVALWAESASFGLLHQFARPEWLACSIAFLLLDLLIWGQHRLMHAWSALWRLHRVHHSDVEFDATTALRFHPLEILLSMGIKMGAVALLGAPAVAVLVFEVALNGSAMFNHANLRLPGPVDRVLRWLVVTPDMHRVHHSVHRREHDRNFGFNLPWWDRLFGTYTAQPADGHQRMTIGLPTFRATGEQRLSALLLQPARTDGAST